MSRKPDPSTLCQHHSKDGKRCRMPLAPHSTSLCAFHAHAEAKRSRFTLTEEGRQSAEATVPLAKEEIAAALLDGASDLSTAAAVNLFLANLLTQVAHNRIARKDAMAMAYIAQLLLNSISVVHRQAKDAQAAKDAAPEPIIHFVPRPCRRRHVDDSDVNLPDDPDGIPQNCHSERSEESAFSRNSNAPTNSPNAAGRTNGHALSPSLRSGESLDSHSSSPAPSHNTNVTPPPVSKICHSERSEESAFQRPYRMTTSSPRRPLPYAEQGGHRPNAGIR